MLLDYFISGLTKHIFLDVGNLLFVESQMMTFNPEIKEQVLAMDQNVNKFYHPLRMVVAGPSGCGKSIFLKNLIKFREQVFTTRFSKIFCVVPSNPSQLHTDIFDEMRSSCPNIEMVMGIPKDLLREILCDGLPKLVMFDDIMSLIFENKFMEGLFLQFSHHNSCSVIFTSQNFYCSSKNKNIMRQLTYKVIFNTLRTDQILLRSLGCLQKCENPNFLIEIFQTLENRFPLNNYLYIVIDSVPHSIMKNMHFRTNVFPNEDGSSTPLCFF